MKGPKLSSSERQAFFLLGFGVGVGVSGLGLGLGGWGLGSKGFGGITFYDCVRIVVFAFEAKQSPQQ